jgi:hypothetical protein
MPPGHYVIIIFCFPSLIYSVSFVAACFKPSLVCTGNTCPWAPSPYSGYVSPLSRIVVGFDLRCGWFWGRERWKPTNQVRFHILLRVTVCMNGIKDSSCQTNTWWTYRSSLFRAPCRLAFGVLLLFFFRSLFSLFVGAACCRSSTNGNTFHLRHLLGLNLAEDRMRDGWFDLAIPVRFSLIRLHVVNEQWW